MVRSSFGIGPDVEAILVKCDPRCRPPDRSYLEPRESGDSCGKAGFCVGSSQQEDFQVISGSAERIALRPTQSQWVIGLPPRLNTCMPVTPAVLSRHGCD